MLFQGSYIGNSDRAGYESATSTPREAPLIRASGQQAGTGKTRSRARTVPAESPIGSSSSSSEEGRERFQGFRA